MARVRPYCTFEVGGLWLGVDVLDVQEVIRHREPTRVPTAPPVVLGLINLRGQIVTMLGLRERLGLAPVPDLGRALDVVVRRPGGPVGLVVDEVGDVLEVDETTLSRTPETIPEAVRRLTSGLFPTPGRSLLVLDLANVVE
jgi:purine-binding chemotaxis protein CheW